MVDIIRRKAAQICRCRGCDKRQQKGEEVIYTYSHRARGQSIFFCLDCAEVIGDLAHTPPEGAELSDG